MPKWIRRRSVKIVLDTSLFVAFVAEFVTREGPDYTIHSWVGMALVPIIAVHLVGNAGWIKRVWNRRGDDREFGLGVFNATIAAVAAVCIVTGFSIWLDWSDAAVWTGIHTITGFASILLMFAHLWKNRGRVARLLGR